MNSSNFLLLLLAILGANLPWFSAKLFYIVPLKSARKNLAWCLLELVVLYFVIGAISMFTERSILGQTSHQDWEFYAITACLFLVFAFPGFVYKTLWR